MQKRIISIHAPQWGATCANSSMRVCRSFQSTHPSGVRQYGTCAPPSYFMISIHAPQWGATAPRVRRPHYRQISIHAPQWGATGITQAGIDSRQFQSTHPSGVRHDTVRHFGPVQLISIHAPQWGATSVVFQLFYWLYISIHAPQWGATFLGRNGRLTPHYFNPRTPVGCD